MGSITPHSPVMLILAAFSRSLPVLQWGCGQMESLAGPVELASKPFRFHQTSYYQKEMGGPLHKQLFGFQRRIDPASLADWKIRCNGWEELARAAHGDAESERPLNLDPGYLTEAKLVLATTKDRDHRIYLSRGIYAEVTLYYHHRQWKTRPWTYPDYAEPHYLAFFDRCRERLREQLRR